MGHRRRQLLCAAIVTAGLAAVPTTTATAAPHATKYDWTQFGFDEQKSANDTAETTVGLADVTGLKKLFSVPLTDAPDGAPVELSDVPTTSGTRDLVFVQGEHGHVTAFDAHTGTTVWSKDFAGSGSFNAAPAIDPNRQIRLRERRRRLRAQTGRRHGHRGHHGRLAGTGRHRARARPSSPSARHRTARATCTRPTPATATSPRSTWPPARSTSSTWAVPTTPTCTSAPPASRTRAP